MRTVSRKLPTISATATIIPMASESAALAIDVRRSDAGIDAEASVADDAERALEYGAEQDAMSRARSSARAARSRPRRSRTAM